MLKPHHFSYQCPLKISDLEETKDGHFCAKCSKDIHDLSDCSIEEVLELQRRKGSICGFVRAVSVTSMVGLAACSKSDEAQPGNEGASNSKPNQEQAIPIDVHPELMGDICIPEEELPKPPVEQAPKDDGAQADTKVEPAEEDLIQVKPIEVPVLMGVICLPEDQAPKKPEQLDPNREDSPA